MKMSPPQDRKKDMAEDIIKILEFLKYDGTVTLHNVDPEEAFA
jgi:hypothetical protein